jgi:hypothetical protein
VKKNFSEARCLIAANWTLYLRSGYLTDSNRHQHSAWIRVAAAGRYPTDKRLRVFCAP